MSPNLWFDYDGDALTEATDESDPPLAVTVLSDWFVDALRERIEQNPGCATLSEDPEEVNAQVRKWAAAIHKATEHLFVESEPAGDLAAVAQEYEEFLRDLERERKLKREIGYALDDKMFGETIEISEVEFDIGSPLALDTNPPWSTRLGYLCEQLFLELLGQAVGMCEKGTRRLLDLSMMTIVAAPAKPTADFLRRVSRCYLWGFDPECIILCRSVLDTAFREAVSDERCESALGLPKGCEFSLSNRIEVAYKKGLISRRARQAAHRVKHRGNKAVHDNPRATQDVHGTVVDTLTVLKAIARA